MEEQKNSYDEQWHLPGYEQRLRQVKRFRRIAVTAAVAAALVVTVILVLIIRNQTGTKTKAPQALKEPPVQTAEVKEPETSPDPEETATAQEPVSLTVTFTGDCTFGKNDSLDYDVSFNAYYDTKGPDYFLQNVRSIFEADDLTVVNFEGTLTQSQERADKQFSFKGDPAYAQILSGSSVEAANLANNHSHDYGEQSYTDTKTYLQEAGITTFGYDETAVVDVKGVKVGLVGIYELKDHLERTQQLKDNIASVKAQGAQLIIVIFHWGNERETTPDENQVTLGHLAIDEGAHVVVGHHPHVIQPIEKYKGRYIAYSMANFCFGGNSSPSDTDTFLFQQTFTVEGDQVAQDDQINLIPCTVTSAEGYNDYCPTPAEGDRAQLIMDRIQAPLE